MRGFFGGWKRKLGVVTLVLACVFAAAWVRSLSVKDRIDLSKIFGVTTKDKQIVAVESDRHSLFIQMNKVDTFVSGPANGMVSFVSTSASSVDAGETEQVPPLTVAPMTAPNSGSGVTGTSVIPLPQSLVTNPPRSLKLVSSPNGPLANTLTAVYEVPFLVIPYWSIVMPLTLLSAWLLLSKSRTFTMTPVTNPEA